MISIQFVPISDGGSFVWLREDISLQGTNLVFSLGDSIPLMIISDLVREEGLQIKVERTDPDPLRAVWEYGVSDILTNGSGKINLPCTDLFVEGIGIKDLRIDWQVQTEDEKDWTSLGTTQHRCYLTLGIPQEPWDANSTEPEDVNRVWMEVLEIACNWAKGASDYSQAAGLITGMLNSCGRFIYDVENGASNYTTSLDYFECEEFIDRIKGGEGFGEKLNCTDCATIVSTLANSLGASLVQSQLMYKFPVNPILAIGTHEWSPPFDGRFSYHEVAWEGGVDSQGKIYDACLHVDANFYADTDEIDKHLPTGIQFGSEELEMYRLLLAPLDEDGYTSCVTEDRSTVIRKID